MHSIRLPHLIAGTITAIVAIAFTTTPTLAADLRAGDIVSVTEDEEVDSDLYLAGRLVSSNAGVLGDVFAAGETLQIGGHVEGGLSAAGETVHIDGEVSRGARVAGATVDVTGRIGRDLMLASREFTLAPGASIGQDLYFGAGSIMLSGDIEGDLRGGAEDLTIRGTVGGNVNVEVGTLVIDPEARILGDLTYRSREEAAIPAGTVEGNVSYSQYPGDRMRGRFFPDVEILGPLAVLASVMWRVSWYLMTLLVGIVLILLTPRRMAGAATVCRTDTGPVAGWGAIALFGTPIAAILISLTFIGLPLGIIVLLLWGILLYLAQLPVSLLIGHLILGHRKPLENKGGMIGALALGLLILTLLRAMPAAGLLIWLATALFGLGGMVVAEHRLAQSRRIATDDTFVN